MRTKAATDRHSLAPLKAKVARWSLSRFVAHPSGPGGTAGHYGFAPTETALYVHAPECFSR